MLLIKTKIQASELHGIGLFADEFIPKGTVTWRFIPGLDLIVHEDHLLRLSAPAREQFLNYCYIDKNTKHFILCFDNERFINHSDNPNIAQSAVESEVDGVEIASKDIYPGEELLCNYYDFDLDASRKLKGGECRYLLDIMNNNLKIDYSPNIFAPSKFKDSLNYFLNIYKNFLKKDQK